MKPLLKDYCGQAGESIPVLLNTPGYQPLYVFPADTGALWLKRTKINPWLTQAEKRMYWKDLRHLKESNQQPNNPASQRARIRAALGIQTAGRKRDVSLLVSLDLILQLQEENLWPWPASPGFCATLKQGWIEPPEQPKVPRDRYPRSSKHAKSRKGWRDAGQAKSRVL